MVDDKVYLTLYRFYVCPGELVHKEYWSLCELNDWHDDYFSYPVLRPRIDSLFRQRLQWEWHDRGNCLTEYQRQWIHWMPKLPAILTSLGIMSLNNAEYFVLGQFRRVLVDLLGDITVNQLSVLCQGENKESIVSADQLPGFAFTLGLQIYSQIVGDDWVGRMIIHTLPPLDVCEDVQLLSQSELEAMNAMLVRLERFI
jgi:Type III secretion system subunit